MREQLDLDTDNFGKKFEPTSCSKTMIGEKVKR